MLSVVNQIFLRGHLVNKIGQDPISETKNWIQTSIISSPTNINKQISKTSIKGSSADIKLISTTSFRSSPAQ